MEQSPGAHVRAAGTGRATSGPLSRVVVVDDHELFRDGLIRGLQQSGYLTVVGEAGTGREGLALIRDERPDVAVVDYQMPDLDGLDVVHAVVRDGLPTRVLLLSARTDGPVVYRALEEGAAGYLSKDSRRAEIVEAVRRVARGETVVPAELAVPPPASGGATCSSRAGSVRPRPSTASSRSRSSSRSWSSSSSR